MMYQSENGTSYAEGFFSVEDNNRIINTFTGKQVGTLVRKLPSTSYLFVGEEPNWFKRMIISWRTGERSPYIPRRDIKVGTLSDTMRELEKDIKKEQL